MITYNKCSRVCGTCRFWEGGASYSVDGNFVSVDQFERARCVGYRKYQQVSSGESCSEHQPRM